MFVHARSLDQCGPSLVCNYASRLPFDGRFICPSYAYLTTPALLPYTCPTSLCLQYFPKLALLSYTCPTSLHLSQFSTSALLPYFPTPTLLPYTYPTSLHLSYLTTLHSSVTNFAAVDIIIIIMEWALRSLEQAWSRPGVSLEQAWSRSGVSPE